MNPNQTKDQDRNTTGKNPSQNPREKQRDDKSTARPHERDPYREDEMKDPVGSPETNQPREDKKDRPAGQKYDPRSGRQPHEDENPLQDSGFESDVLKPGR